MQLDARPETTTHPSERTRVTILPNGPSISKLSQTRLPRARIVVTRSPCARTRRKLIIEKIMKTNIRMSGRLMLQSTDKLPVLQSRLTERGNLSVKISSEESEKGKGGDRELYYYCKAASIPHFAKPVTDLLTALGMYQIENNICDANSALL